MSKVNVGVIFKSYEPLSAIQAYAAQTEASGYGGGFWIAEAYHWFRSYGLEARGCFTALAAATMATKEITIGLGITSPYMRHPTIQASECAGIDELSGGRFVMGIGVGKVGIEYLEYDIASLRRNYTVKCSSMQGALLCIRREVGGRTHSPSRSSRAECRTTTAAGRCCSARPSSRRATSSTKYTPRSTCSSRTP